MRVALFVEGSFSPTAARQQDALTRLWNEHIPRLAGCVRFSAVHPISKQNIENLDPSRPRSSGNHEALDELFIRKLGDPPRFDAAVVAWDIEPPLRPAIPLTSMRCPLVESDWIIRRLAEGFAKHARLKQWHQTTSSWLAAGEHRRPSKPITFHEVRMVCMEPEFEAMLLDEITVRDLLGVQGKRLKGWPSDWQPTPQRRGKQILHEAVEAVRALGSNKFPPIIGTFARSAPNEWAEWMIRKQMETQPTRARLTEQPVIQRLRELLRAEVESPSTSPQTKASRQKTRAG